MVKVCLIHFTNITQNSLFVGRAYLQLSNMYFNSGSSQEALDYANMSLAAGRKDGRKGLEANGLRHLSNIHRRQGHLQVAYTLAYESEVQAEIVGDFYAKALSIHTRGYICTDLCRYSQALSLFVEGDHLLEAVGVECTATSRYLVKTMQAEVHLRKAEYDDARRLNEFLLSLNVDGSSKAYALLNIAKIDIATNTCPKPAITECNIELARQFFLTRDEYVGVSVCEITLGALHSHQGDHKKAIQIYFQVMNRECSGSLCSSEIMMLCFQNLSDCMGLTANSHGFLHYTILYLVFALKISNCAAIHGAIRRLGDVFLHHQDGETALNLWQLALNGLTAMDIHQERAECMVHIGDHMHSKEKLEEARVLWKAAIPLYVRSVQDQGVTRCKERLRYYTLFL